MQFLKLKLLLTGRAKAILRAVISVSILIYICLFETLAYTVSQAGVNKLYTWSWIGAENAIRSRYIEGGSGPSLQLSANAFGVTATQNGGVNVSATPLNETINVAAEDENEITIWVAGERTTGMFSEANKVIFSTSTGRDDAFSTTRDFTLQLEYHTILHVEDSPNWDGGTVGDASNLRLYNAGTEVYNLQPSYTLVEELLQNSTSDEDYTFYRVIAFFVVDNYNQEKVTFDEIEVRLSCDINFPPEGYANRYRISVGNPELYELTPQEVLDQIEAQQAANDDLILKLGEVNEVDQAQINSGKDTAAEGSGLVGDLSDAESRLDMDTSDIDFSAPSEVLDSKEGIDSYWKIFFNDQSLGLYLSSIITVVILMASLSIVLYGLKK